MYYTQVIYIMFMAAVSGGMVEIMIKNIIFDIGNVLAEFRWKGFIDELGFEESIQERIAKATVLSKYWKEVDRGVMTWQEIIEGCVSLDKDIEREIKLFFKDQSNLVVEFDYSGLLLKTLKNAGYNIYILSNYSEKNFKLVKDSFSFMKYIDGGVVSYEVKAIKPEPVIYKTLLEKYQLIPEECVFLDDLIENLNEAANFGIQTIHFTGLTEGVKGLKKLGIDMKYDGIIFDLDGTLWDSTETAAKVWTEEAKKQGVTKKITKEELRKLYGLPLEEIATNLFSDIDKEKALSIMEKSVVVQCPVLAKKGGLLFKNMEEVLIKLHEKYPLFIVSNCRSGYIEAFLEYFGFNKYFKDYECPGRTGLLKADNIRLVMDRNNLVNPIYIGDTAGDKKASDDALVLFIHAAYGFGVIDEYGMAAKTPEELLELI